VSAVYEDCQAYEGGSSVGVECVEGGAYGAAGVEDVVNEDYGFAVETAHRDQGLPRAAVFIFLIGEVIAIRGNIESAQAIFEIKI